uniref:Fibroblast growth factor receptor-like 1 n=1 Tax=Sinocyclocheilus grahami TaxID=75366 RepID=A0A672KEH8_SINGR
MYQRPNGEDMELFQVEVLMRPPKIENTGAQHKRVANGDNFLVDCVASGLPDPEVSWSLPDGTMINNKDEGNYTCYAKNTLGEDAMKVSVQVMPNSPQITSKEKRVIARPVGSSVRLKCTASGNPRPDIVWLKDSRPLTPEEVGEGRKKKWTLSLKNLTPEHSGKYTCHVSNRAGEINATYKVELSGMLSEFRTQSFLTNSVSVVY